MANSTLQKPDVGGDKNSEEKKKNLRHLRRRRKP